MPAQHLRIGRRLVALINAKRIVGGAVFVVVVVHFRAVAGGAHIREQPAVAMPEHQPQPVVMVVFAAPGTVLNQQRLLRPSP